MAVTASRYLPSATVETGLSITPSRIVELIISRLSMAAPDLLRSSFCSSSSLLLSLASRRHPSEVEQSRRKLQEEEEGEGEQTERTACQGEEGQEGEEEGKQAEEEQEEETEADSGDTGGAIREESDSYLEERLLRHYAECAANHGCVHVCVCASDFVSFAMLLIGLSEFHTDQCT